MRKLLPLILALSGLGAGIGAGLALRPDPPAPEAVETAEAAAGEAPAETAPPPMAGGDHPAEGAPEYVKLNNQFVVPVVTGGRVTALVVLSVSLQVGPGMREEVFAREPRLRDAFLQVLFDHANAGGFDGVFTSAENLRRLRMALLEAAQRVLGATAGDILITDMMRQES